MAEAQFKCPETQPTPARAEGGRGNGAAPLPRGPTRARTQAAQARRPHPSAWSFNQQRKILVQPINKHRVKVYLSGFSI